MEELKKYLRNLKWDGVDRLSALSGCVNVTNMTKDEWDDLLMSFIVDMVANPLSGINTQSKVLVLQGKQGIGKSTFAERLLPFSLKGWINYYMYEHRLLASNMLLIVDDGEVKVGDLVRASSSKYVSFRKEYEPSIRLHDVISSVIYVTNDFHFLEGYEEPDEQLGIVSMESIDWVKFNSIDKCQLVAQAVDLNLNYQYQLGTIINDGRMIMGRYYHEWTDRNNTLQSGLFYKFDKGLDLNEGFIRL